MELDMENMDVYRPLNCVHEYNVDVTAAVREANLTPTTEMVSQVFGGLMATHENIRQIVPDYLTGCVDEIYAYGLNQLHRVALFQRNPKTATNDELTKSIVAVLDALRADMRHNVNKPVFSPASEHCTCKKSGSDKKGSCQSPIMEA